jgi:hypothetical protein
MGSVVFVFCITMMFAFPVWCLYLPFIFSLRDVEGWRSALLLLAGILIGPAALTVWGLIHLPMGENLFQRFWDGDPETSGGGGGYFMIFASVVGFLTSAIYVLFLKFAHSRQPYETGLVSLGLRQSDMTQSRRSPKSANHPTLPPNTST